MSILGWIAVWLIVILIHDAITSLVTPLNKIVIALEQIKIENRARRKSK